MATLGKVLTIITPMVLRIYRIPPKKTCDTTNRRMASEPGLLPLPVVVWFKNLCGVRDGPSLIVGPTSICQGADIRFRCSQAHPPLGATVVGSETRA